MPVTFNDINEAKEYATQMTREGYILSSEKIGNKYIIKIISRRSAYNPATDTIHLEPHASTTEKLHELGHKVHKHQDVDPENVEEYTRHEIEAQIFSFEKMGRKIDYRIGIPLHTMLVAYWNLSPLEALDLIVKELDKKGISVNKEEKGIIFNPEDSKWYEKVKEDEINAKLLEAQETGEINASNI